MKTMIPAETLRSLELVLTAFEAADPVSGRIARMRLVDGATWTEIAAAVDMSRATVAARFDAVIRVLRDALTRLDSENAQ